MLPARALLSRERRAQKVWIFLSAAPPAVYGADYKAQICGSDVSEKPLITYPRTNEDYIANLAQKDPLKYKFYGICVASCPGALDVVCNYGIGEGMTNTVKQNCITDSSYTPPAGPVTCAVINSNCWITPQATSPILFRCIPVYNTTNNAQAKCIFPSSVTSAYDPACIVAQDDTAGSVQRPAKPNLLFDQLNAAQQVWGRWFGDLARAWWVILICSVGLALVLGFVWVFLLKYFTACMVYTIIYFTLLTLAFLTGYFYWKAGLVNITVPQSLTDKLRTIPGWETAQTTARNAVATASAQVPEEWTANSEQYTASYKGLAYAFTAVLMIVLCLVVALRKAIRMAVEVIKVGSDALRALPTLILFPCTNVLAFALFLVWWCFVAACLNSAGTVTLADVTKDVAAGVAALSSRYNITVPSELDATKLAFLSSPTVNSTYSYVETQPIMQYLIIYHIFGLLWTTSFIQGVATMTVAGAVAGWYFSRLPEGTPADSELNKLKYDQGTAPIYNSLVRTLRFHLGSVAFGSLLIAIIQAIRIIFAYIQKKMKDAGQNNTVAKFVMCCIQCCLSCLQTLVEVVTRNAYVFVALKGDSFCGAGGRVFKLIVSHGSVFMVVNVLGEIIMFLGKVLIASISAWGAYILLENITQFGPGGANALSSTWLPVLVTVFFSYAVASGFMSVFDLSIDTVLVCYCTDIDENLERNKGDKKFEYAVHLKKSTMDIAGKVAAEESAEAAKSAGAAKSAVVPAAGKAVSVS